MKFGLALNDLRLQAIIGILPFERERAQEIAVDLDLSYEIAKNDLDSLESKCDSAHDSRESIIDYAFLREMILDLFKKNNFLYLESALVAIQREILERFPQILELDLSIKKLAIFSDCTPKVRLSWQKGEKLQGLDCHDLPKASLAMTSEGDSHESHRNDGNGNTK